MRELKDDPFVFGVSNSMELFSRYIACILHTCSVTCSGPKWKFHSWRWQRLELACFGGQKGINSSHLKYKMSFRDPSRGVIQADRYVSLELSGEVKVEGVFLRVIRIQLLFKVIVLYEISKEENIKKSRGPTLNPELFQY